MDPSSDHYHTEVFRLVRNLGSPPPESWNTLSSDFTLAENCLSSLQRRYDELLKEMNTHRFTINAIRSLDSPWRRLPAELLAEIFSYCTPDDGRRRPSRLYVPLTLTQVCSTWYRIATDIPQLWTSVVLISDHPYPLVDRLAHGTEYLRACALRSKDAFIELDLNIHFISYRPSYELIKRYSHQISHLSFHYPESTSVCNNDQLHSGACSWFCHSNDQALEFPNLRSLEIHDPNPADNLSEADFTQLRLIADSARCLQRYMFHNRSVQPDGPVPANWTNITELTLIDPTPVALLSHILRHAPLLRYASFNCLYHSLATTINMPLRTMLSNPILTVPFTHRHLKTLLIGYGDFITLSTLFNLITAPNLTHILLEKWSEEPDAWAQESFITFFRRSECSLRALDLYFTPVTTVQLLEILEVPCVGGSLTELMIYNGHSEVDRIIDDDFCQRLTLPSSFFARNPHLSGNHSTTGNALCPHLEAIGFQNCHSCAMPTLLRMLRSRLDPLFEPRRSSVSSSSSTSPVRNCLKYFETNIPPELAQQYLKPLVRDGLVTLLYDSNTNPLPITEEEKRMLRRFTEDGLKLWEYDPVQGAWGPTDFWTKL